MKHRRFGLRTQFIVLIIIGLSALFVAIAVVTVSITTNNLRKSLINESKQFAALATKPIGDSFATYQDSGTLRIVQQIEKFTTLNESISDVKVVDLEGNELFQHGQKADFKVTTEQASSFKPVYVYKGNTITHIVYPYLEDFGAHRYSLVYSVSYDSINSSVRQLTTGILVLAGLALCISIAVTYMLISRLFLDPLSQVSHGAMEISKGKLDLSIVPKRNDEIGDLAQSVNTMAEALKADIRKLKEVDAIKTEFMMIASHNLRTPLTIIQGYLDTLLLSKELPPAVRNTVEVVAASGSRLSVFAEDILTVSRLEAGENVMSQRDKTDLHKLLEQIGKNFLPLASEKKLVFETNLGSKSCEATVSMPHIRAAIWNLLDNALKFTTEGKITLELKQSEGKAHITISDTGEGIAPDEVPKLFTKFHRGTSTMRYDHQGTGIGLYLTKLIIDQHSGTITLDTQLDTGTAFMITIPLTS